MTKAVTDDMLGRIAIRSHEVLRRVKEGTLGGRGVLRDLQAIVEGRTVDAINMNDYIWVRLTPSGKKVLERSGCCLGTTKGWMKMQLHTLMFVFGPLLNPPCMQDLFDGTDVRFSQP